MNEFYDKLDALYGGGDLAAVEAFILEAVGDAEDGGAARAGLLNELAGFYRGVSRYAESIDAFTRSLEIFDAVGMGATPEYATVLLNLAGLYRMKGEADKAEGLFLSAMKKLEDAGARDSYAYVSVLNNLSLAYQEKGELALALEYAGNALELMRSGIGGDHEIAASLNNLAAIRLRMGDVDAANGLITEALGIYDAMPETDVHHAAALATKAALLCRYGEYHEALEGFRRALELTRRFFGENIEYAICKRNIADVFELLGDKAAAISELTDAARIFERIHGADSGAARDARGRLERLRGEG